MHHNGVNPEQMRTIYWGWCILYIRNVYPSDSNLDTFRRTLCNICKPAVEKRGRPESIHHVSAREVEVVGRGRYSILNLKASFLPVKMSSFHHAKVWTPKMWYIAQWMVLCAVLAVGPLLLTSTSRPTDVIHVMNAPRPSPFNFSPIFQFHVIL